MLWLAPKTPQTPSLLLSLDDSPPRPASDAHLELLLGALGLLEQPPSQQQQQQQQQQTQTQQQQQSAQTTAAVGTVADPIAAVVAGDASAYPLALQSLQQQQQKQQQLMSTDSVAKGRRKKHGTPHHTPQQPQQQPQQQQEQPLLLTQASATSKQGVAKEFDEPAIDDSFWDPVVPTAAATAQQEQLATPAAKGTSIKVLSVGVVVVVIVVLGFALFVVAHVLLFLS